MSLQHRSLPIPEGLHGVRADAGLARLLGFSRTFAQQVLQAGAATQAGTVLSKSDRLQEGELLTVSWEPRLEPRVTPTEVSALRVLHEDADIIVISKPAGVSVHPSRGWTGPTVLGALASSGVTVANEGPQERQGVVHRLDAGTSGVMVVAKSSLAFHELKTQFKTRQVQKTYHALVQGHPDPTRGTLEGPIARLPGNTWRFGIVPGGKDAITHYELLHAYPGFSLLRIRLETGRTHQIRVHMAAHGHPLAGDKTYGADPEAASRLKLQRQWLHSVTLKFSHPATGATVSFQSDYDKDLDEALAVVARELS